MVTWCVVVAALGAGGWLVTRPNPGDWLPGLGPSSKDDGRSLVIGSPAPTSATDPNPFSVDRYFPPTRQIDLGGFHAKRARAQQGGDCSEIVQDPAKNPLHDIDCQGYLTVSFVRQDTKVITSVTVLRFADDAAAAKAVAALQGQGGALRFMTPDSGVAQTPPAAGAKNDQAPRAEAVNRYVTVTGSRFADGHGPATSPDPDLAEATRDASYTAGAAFMWS
ncbi:hypothetical protein GCM10009665_36330 [Kitasatospora nipponensis]|uniref:Uncharacterized protein n=1 Tax=Kitasatospora nipponensis TaxID=258049 RepID=A0ABN1WCW1_9ACTN